MRRSRFNLATLSLAIFATAAVVDGWTRPIAVADDWRTYHNERYGTTIEYPVFFKPGTPPENGDGLAFKSPDSAEFSVFASYNALDFDLAGLQDFIVKNIEAGEVITYRAHGDDWFVISGTKGTDRLFYERHLLSHRTNDRGFRHVLSASAETEIRSACRAHVEIVPGWDWFPDAGKAVTGRTFGTDGRQSRSRRYRAAKKRREHLSSRRLVLINSLPARC